MKARSVIFTHVQHPPTIFGMPPLMTLSSIGAGMLTYVVAVFAGAIPIALMLAALVTVAGMVKAYRLGRADRHFETVFAQSLTFWGFSSRRGLTTGAFPPQRSQDGGRS